MRWILAAFFCGYVVLSIWGGCLAYDFGVWDGVHNPSIPPVKAALERLRRRGWQ